MTDKHAPAPWTFVANNWQHITVYDADELPVCRMDLEDWPVNEDNQDAFEQEQAKVAAMIAAAPDLLTAAKALERAEAANANCDECEGEGVPELCPKCFPLFDDARVLRRLAIAKACPDEPSPQVSEGPDHG